MCFFPSFLLFKIYPTLSALKCKDRLKSFLLKEFLKLHLNITKGRLKQNHTFIKERQHKQHETIFYPLTLVQNLTGNCGQQETELQKQFIFRNDKKQHKIAFYCRCCFILDIKHGHISRELYVIHLTTDAKDFCFGKQYLLQYFGNAVETPTPELKDLSICNHGNF